MREKIISEFKELLSLETKLNDYISSMYDDSFEAGLIETRKILEEIEPDSKLYYILQNEFASRLNPKYFVFVDGFNYLFFGKRKKFFVDGSDIAIIMEKANINKLSRKIGKIHPSDIGSLMIELYEVKK